LEEEFLEATSLLQETTQEMGKKSRNGKKNGKKKKNCLKVIHDK